MNLERDPARAIPVLPSPDIEATKRFYTDELGFEARHHVAEDYLIIRRGEIEIHFWKSADEALPKVSSCYIRGGEVADLHAEYYARRLSTRLSDFTLRPWNMREFYVWDPHGNLLRFGCIPEAS